MELSPDIDIIVSNVIHIDFSIYPLWLQFMEGKYFEFIVLLTKIDNFYFSAFQWRLVRACKSYIA